MTHSWHETETYCEDCGSHSAMVCEWCGTLVEYATDADSADQESDECPGTVTGD